MKVAKAAEMRLADKLTIEEIGIPGIVLMENASQAVYRRAASYLYKNHERKVLILVGKGNNGGDGLAVARLLKQRNFDVTIGFVGEISQTTGDALLQLEIVKKLDIPIVCGDWEQLTREIQQAPFIVDGLLGTGLTGEVREPIRSIIREINRSNAYVISIDIPSGIDSDTGRICGVAVRANETVTFALPKRGLILDPGAERAGKVTIADISIPEQVLRTIPIKCETLDKAEAAKLLPIREKRSNKGTYGRLFMLAGSPYMTGAAVLCAKSAYRSGAGLVYACAGEEVRTVIKQALPEAVLVPFVKQLEGVELPDLDLASMDAVVAGPGLGRSKEAEQRFFNLIQKVSCPMVLDADGLNLMAENPSFWQDLDGLPVITPHPGEMSRLTGISVEDILQNTVKAAMDFSKERQVITVLKDSSTVVTHPDGRIYINQTGNPAMAKAGSGDVLSGVIGGLLAQGLDSYQAAVLGVYIHGLAGDLAAEKLGQYGGLASQLSDYLALAFRSLEKELK